MGGHGGLNILPQKRWNVYGRDNRLKVARDEEKYNAEQKIKQDAHTQAEQQHRRDQLLERARRRDPESQLPDRLADADPAIPVLEQTAALHAQSHLVHAEAAKPLPPIASQLAGGREEALAPADPSTGQLAATAAPGAGMLQHINFFQDFERREAHPDNKREKKDEQRRRGNPETQTSDARFDAQFRLANGLYGKQNAPWYSKAGSTLPGPEDTTIHADELAAEMLRQNGLLHVGGPQKNGNAASTPTTGGLPTKAHIRRLASSIFLHAVSTSAAPPEKKRHKDKAKSKHGRKHKVDSASDDAGHRKHRKKQRCSSSGNDTQGADISRRAAKGHSNSPLEKKGKLERLRAERFEREAAEQKRQRQALSAEVPAGTRPNRRYHSGFGNAAR